MLDSLRKSAGSWIAKIFIALLVLSFAVWGIADIFTGIGTRTVATVGDTEISTEEYQQAFEIQVQNLSQRMGRRLSTQQAQQLGIDRQVLASLIGAAALNHQAAELSLGISNKAIADSVQLDPAFRGLDGQFDRNRFIEVLRINGLTEQGYISRQRNAVIRNQIVNSLFTSIKIPEIYTEAVDRFSREKRVLKYVVLPLSKAAKIDAPNDDALRKFHQSRKRLFTAPEYRKIGLLAVQPSEIKKTIKVTDEEIRAQYDPDPARFGEPEKRRVQQIAFTDEAAANKAHAELKGGKSFEAVAKANGFSESEIDLGTIAASGMSDKKIRDVAFALKKGAYSAPVTGALATVIVKVTDIKPAVKKSFSDVKAKIADGIALERAQNKVQDLLDQIEDERAGGASLAEIGAKLELNYRTIAAVDRSGNGADGKPVKDVPVLEQVIRVAFGSDVGVETDAIETGDGGYEWIEVLDVTPEKLKAFDKIKNEVNTEYMKVEQSRALAKLSNELIERIKNGEDLATVARSLRLPVKTSKPVKRSETQKDLTQAAVKQAFALGKNGLGAAGGEKSTTRVLFQVSDVIAPEPLKDEEAKREKARISQTLLEDFLAQYVRGLQDEYGVRVNEGVFQRITGRDQG